MKFRLRQIIKKSFLMILSVAILISNYYMPVYAQAESDYVASTGDSLVIEKPQGVISNELVSRSTARNGNYTGEDGSSITWSLSSSGVLTVSGSGCLRGIWYDSNNVFFGSDIKSVKINTGITSLDDGTFYQCTNLTNVTLPTSVTSIGFGAFYECTSLPAINIPASVSYIGEYAFYSCSSLQSITLPSSVTTIDTEAFANCTSLTSASIYGDIGTDAFNNCVALSSLTINGTPLFIGDSAFAYCTSLSSVNMPSSVAEVGFGAFADCESLISANINGNLLESAFDGCYSLKNVTLNSSCQSIGRRAFADCRAIATLTLPNTVKTIDEAAFQGCENLTSISLPSSLNTLGNHAFYDCKSLESITIPSSVTKIEDCLFSNCFALTTVNTHNGITSIGDGAFGNCAALSSMSIPNGCTSIGEQAFYGCTNLQNIAIPGSIITIGNAAFYQCEKIQSISIPQSVKVVPNHVFAFCGSLTNVSLPNGLTEIGNYAFSSCTSLASVVLPSSLNTIGEYAFYECSSLIDISIPSGVTALPEGVFAMCKALQTVILPGNMTEIDKAAFINCDALCSINIPSSLTYLGMASFAGCNSLKSIILPAGVTSILDSTFLDCENLENVTISGNATSIGDYCFAQCISLTSISIPNTVTSIGQQAFSFCNNLSVANLPQQLTSLGTAAFLGCGELKSIAIGRYVLSIGNDAFAACTSLSSLTLDSNNHNFSIIDNVLYTADKTRLISFVPTNTSVSVTIPDTVTNTGELTFYQCKNIESITLPSSLTEIGDLMFYNCTELESITIPDSVTKIGSYAFSGCEKMNSISIPSSVQSIGEGAFYNCKRLGAVSIPEGISIINHGAFYGCSALTSLMLPSTITEIDDYAFALCRTLGAIQLPQNLTAIGEYAFAGCESLNISSIPSSVTDLGEGAFAECSSLTSISLPSGISHISDFLFYDCPSLESVDLHGDVYAIGHESFSSSKSLSKVVFAGNVPGVIGARAFANTSSDLVLHYEQAAEGWTTPQWTGPDQLVYQTSTVYSGTCGQNLEWNLVTATGELSIWGTGEMYNWDNASETPWHPYVDMIRSVTLNEGVTSVGARAFQSTPQLAYVFIPSTVVNAGYAAFADCLQLKDATCVGGLNTVSQCMFYNDDQLFNIEFSNKVTGIPDYAFYGCCNLGDIRIPSSVKTIGEGAFASCVSIESIVFGGSLTSIGTGAFFNCAGLSKIYLNAAKPKSVGNYAFFGCGDQLSVVGSTDVSWLDIESTSTLSSEDSAILSGTAGALTWTFNPGEASLTISGNGELPAYEQGTAPWLIYSALISTIIVDEGVTKIGEMALSEMSCVTTISLPDSLHAIGPYAFSGGISLKDCILPTGLTSIGEGAFCCCEFLTTIELPSSITSIPAYLFSECYNLKSVIASGNISSIGYGAFNSCINLKNTNFLGNVQSVDAWAFAFCQSLTDSVKINGSVGEYAFYCCGKIRDVDFSEISSMGEYAFSQTGITKASLNISTIPISAFELCEELTDLVCLSNVKTIEVDSFYGCKSLVNLSLGSVTNIKDYAFMASGIISVQIPDSVTYLGVGVFADCINLTDIRANGVFSSNDGILYKDSILLQYPAGKWNDSFTIQDNVDSVSDYAFYGCKNLKSIKIGNRVSNIGKASFAYCGALCEIVLGSKIINLPDAVFGGDSELTSIVFCGNSPSYIGEDALYLTSDQLVFKYLSGKIGWTDNQWIGPDGKSHLTECVSENYSVTLDKIDNTTMRLKLNCAIPERDSLAIVVSSQIDGKTVATRTKIVNSESAVYTISLSGNSADVFLLDAETAAPLTEKKSLSGFSASGSDNYNIIIQKANTVLTSRAVNESMPVTQHEICSTEVHDITVTELKARAVDLERPCVISTYRIDKSSFKDWTHAFQNGGVISLIVSKKNVVFRLDASRALAGDYRQANALAYGDIKITDNITFRDAKGNFMRPRFQHDSHLDVGILGLSSQSWHSLLRDNVKVKLEKRTKIVHAQGDISLDTEGELDLSAKLKFAETGFEMTGYGAKRGEELFQFSGDLGVGPGWSAAIPLGDYGSLKGFTSDTISVGIGLQTTKKGWDPNGVNANLDLKVHPKEMVKFIKAEYTDDFVDWANTLYAIAVETIDDANHKVDQQAFIRYTMDAQNNVKDAWQMPNYTAKYLQGDTLYSQALPKSSGGTVMPAQSNQQTGQQTGGGNVNTSGKNNNLTQAQKDAIRQATTAAEQAGKVPTTTADTLINQYTQQKAFADFNYTNYMEKIFNSLHPGLYVYQTGGPMF